MESKKEKKSRNPTKIKDPAVVPQPQPKPIPPAQAAKPPEEHDYEMIGPSEIPSGIPQPQPQSQSYWGYASGFFSGWARNPYYQPPPPSLTQEQAKARFKTLHDSINKITTDKRVPLIEQMQAIRQPVVQHVTASLTLANDLCNLAQQLMASPDGYPELIAEDAKLTNVGKILASFRRAEKAAKFLSQNAPWGLTPEKIDGWEKSFQGVQAAVVSCGAQALLPAEAKLQDLSASLLGLVSQDMSSSGFYGGDVSSAATPYSSTPAPTPAAGSVPAKPSGDGVDDFDDDEELQEGDPFASAAKPAGR